MCILNNCNHKEKYGRYCSKHKRIYLMDNNKIIINRWTNKSSDYLKKDIFENLMYIGGEHSLSLRDKKEVLFLELSNRINILLKYNIDIKKILQIQRKFKSILEGRLNNLRGEGYSNKKLCNNEVDFFSFETVDELNDKYFFSYKDGHEIIWFFDIRSFNKLIELKQPNPYTMEKIPNNVIRRSKKLTKALNLNKGDELINHEEIKKTKKQIIKQKTIDLFSDIEQSGYYCHPEWFLSLNIIRLRRLYRNLEDLWNYRLQLTNHQKSRICPPNGVAFNRRVNEVMNIPVIEDIQNLILNEIIKFQNAQSSEDKKLGYMYFIIGLGSGISQDCFNCHTWIAYC